MQALLLNLFFAPTWSSERHAFKPRWNIVYADVLGMAYAHKSMDTGPISAGRHMIQSHPGASYDWAVVMTQCTQVKGLVIRLKANGAGGYQFGPQDYSIINIVEQCGYQLRL